MRSIETELEQSIADVLQIKDPVVEVVERGSWSIVSGGCWYCDQSWTRKIKLVAKKVPEAEGKVDEADLYICDHCEAERRSEWLKWASIVTLYTRRDGDNG